MRMTMKFLLVVWILILFSGCCITFSDLTSGNIFNVGSTVTTARVNILVEQFQWGNGNWTNTGHALVDNRNFGNGSGNDLNANNVNLNFQLNFPVKKITLSFGEYGGNVNIMINGDFKNIGNLNEINGTAIDNVSITVNATQQNNNWRGTMILEGIISKFAIGGQELWIDTICSYQ